MVLKLYFLAFFALCLCSKCNTKLLSDNRTSNDGKSYQKFTSQSGLLFADELKQTLERYLFGICPQTYKMPLAAKARNSSALTCDLDTEHNDLAARLASLSLRAHSTIRADCTQLAAALANTFGELARTATQRTTMNNAAATNESNKKRKMSKSQKAKLQAKQRTALAVKKKAAAAAAASAKITA